MAHSTSSYSVKLKTDADKKLLMEQYKVLIDSMNKLNDMRETANNFWIALNGALMGVLAYIRDSQSMGWPQKSFLLFTVLFFGLVLTLSWLSSLNTMKKNMELKNGTLIELEQYFPAKIFTANLRKTGKEEKVVLREMFVPFMFLLGYLFFAFLLWIAPAAVVPQ